MARGAITSRKGYGAAGSGDKSYSKGPNDCFKEGVWNFRDWNTGFKRKSDVALKLSIYDGNAYVAPEGYDKVNPQNFVRGIPDRQNVPWSQPTPPPVFIAGGTATPSFPPTQVPGSSNMLGAQMFGQTMMG